jgi:hypothetical protein
MGEAPENHIEVAILGKAVYLKPHGYATQRNSLGIPDFLGAMFRAGCQYAIFDLADCRGMDSTFLGVIADAATASARRGGKTVAVLNAGDRARRQLQRVGLMPMLCLREGELELPPGVELRRMDYVPFPKDRQSRLRKVRDLHQQLVRLNEGNRKLFGQFLEMLDQELKQSAGQSGDNG